MRITFLGTRGYIESKNDRHQRHSALLVEHEGRRVMVDAGEDWRDSIFEIAPDAIVLTHAHPDHAWGLSKGAPCPVYATEVTWYSISRYPIEHRHKVRPGTPVDVQGMRFTAFPVAHSIRAPAVAYRIEAGTGSMCYAPDVVSINDRTGAMHAVALFVGDGATIERSMVRRSGGVLIGHTPVRTQLGWCRQEDVPRALFTHCGTGIVAGNEPDAIKRVRALGTERAVDADLAYDGLTVELG